MSDSDSEKPPRPPALMPHQTRDERLMAYENWSNAVYHYLLVAYTRNTTNRHWIAILQTIVLAIVGPIIVVVLQLLIKAWWGK